MTNIRKNLKKLIKSEIELIILKIKLKKVQHKCEHQYKIIGVYPDYYMFLRGKILTVYRCEKCHKINKKLS